MTDVGLFGPESITWRINRENTSEEAEQAASAVWNVHGRVTGSTDDAAGPFPAGTA